MKVIICEQIAGSGDQGKEDLKVSEFRRIENPIFADGLQKTRHVRAIFDEMQDRTANQTTHRQGERMTKGESSCRAGVEGVGEVLSKDDGISDVPSYRFTPEQASACQALSRSSCYQILGDGWLFLLERYAVCRMQ